MFWIYSVSKQISTRRAHSTVRATCVKEHVIFCTPSLQTPKFEPRTSDVAHCWSNVTALIEALMILPNMPQSLISFIVHNYWYMGPSSNIICNWLWPWFAFSYESGEGMVLVFARSSAGWKISRTTEKVNTTSKFSTPSPTPFKIFRGTTTVQILQSKPHLMGFLIQHQLNYLRMLRLQPLCSEYFMCSYKFYPCSSFSHVTGSNLLYFELLCLLSLNFYYSRCYWRVFFHRVLEYEPFSDHLFSTNEASGLWAPKPFQVIQIYQCSPLTEKCFHCCPARSHFLSWNQHFGWMVPNQQ